MNLFKLADKFERKLKLAQEMPLASDDSIKGIIKNRLSVLNNPDNIKKAMEILKDIKNTEEINVFFLFDNKNTGIHVRNKQNNLEVNDLLTNSEFFKATIMDLLKGAPHPKSDLEVTWLDVVPYETRKNIRW